MLTDNDANWDDNHYRAVLTTIHSRIGTLKFLSMVAEVIPGEGLYSLRGELMLLINEYVHNLSNEEWPEHYSEPYGSTPSERSNIQRLKR